MEENIDYIRKFSDKCHVSVRRKGEDQPCDQMATAVAVGDSHGGSWFPVCPHHSRGRWMVPLNELIEALGSNI